VKKKPIFGIICLVIIPAVIIFGDQVNPDNLKDSEIDGSNVFHIRLPTQHYMKGESMLIISKLKKESMNLDLCQMVIAHKNYL